MLAGRAKRRENPRMSPKFPAWMTDEGDHRQETRGWKSAVGGRDERVVFLFVFVSDKKVEMLKCQLDIMFQNPEERSKSCWSTLTRGS